MYCWKCKSQIRDDARFCNVCGADQSAQQTPPSYAQQNPAYGQQTPAYTQQNPAYGQQNPAYTQQNPAYAQNASFGQPAPAKNGGNNKLKILIPVIAAVVVVIGVVLAIVLTRGSDDDTPVIADPTAADSVQDATVADDTTVEPTETEQTEPADSANTGNTTEFSAFTVEKVDSFDLSSDTYIYNFTAGGIVYKERSTGKYGILNIEAKSDTNAIYTNLEANGKYFEATTAETGSFTNITDVNCCGLIDGSGNVVIPMEYAAFDTLNDRFMQVYKVTEQTDNKDEALVFISDNMFSIFADEDDVLLKGTWYIYDLEEGRLVPGVSGTNKYYIHAYGDIIKYTSDEKETICVKADGQVLPENTEVFENGCYRIGSSSEGVLYDSDHNKIYEYGEDDFRPNYSEDEYIILYKYVDGESMYALMDDTGKVVSTEFTETPYVYGDLLDVKDRIYDFEGNQVIEGEYDSIYMDETFKDIWFLKNNSTVTIIDRNGNILYQGSENDVEFDYYTYYTISKKSGDSTLFYSWEDGDFVLDAYAYEIAPWLVETNKKADNTVDIIDTVSGKTIIKGHTDYKAFVNEENACIYIIGYNDDVSYDYYVVR
ncbi:MAG: hypothetical protein E7523_10800 [Ruminococcaceae bacterium]|nr:hypothetical protein [Oscillospiraceae bacterium]